MKKISMSSRYEFKHILALMLVLIFCTSALAGGQKRPQIPKVDFEWKGSFKGNDPFHGNDDDLSAPQVTDDLIIRGKWQTSDNGEFFNLYMKQGDKYSDTFVENLIYENKLYTITHIWHTELSPLILGKCIRNEIYNTENPEEPLPITVDGFNIGLASARLVGLEKIGGKPMNHFRHTCKTMAAVQLPPYLNLPPSNPADENNKIAIPFKVFSDIYVRAGKSYPWAKWLQFGDGVGPDSQEDEWFLVNETNKYPDEIVLPKECKIGNEWPFNEQGAGLGTLIFVQQTTCTNLVPSEPED